MRCLRSTALPFEARICCSDVRGIWMPALAYAHCTRPEQSKPVCGVDPPQRYGVPRYLLAVATAASRARARGARAAAVRDRLELGRRRRPVRRPLLRALPQEAAGLLEAQLVAAAVLHGRALDVGDPFAVAAGVVHRLAGRDALLLDSRGLIEEPLQLQLRLVGIPGVVALVPDAHSHLEEPDGVRIAAAQVP